MSVSAANHHFISPALDMYLSAAPLKAGLPKIMMIPPEGALAKGVYFLIR